MKAKKPAPFFARLGNITDPIGVQFLRFDGRRFGVEIFSPDFAPVEFPIIPFAEAVDRIAALEAGAQARKARAR